MKHFDEYVHFVVGAKIAGCEIECQDFAYASRKEWFTCKEIFWNWEKWIYRIKLPEGWEYVIEDGEIAFREPREGEGMLMMVSNGCIPKIRTSNPKFVPMKYPIIKRIKK